MELLSPLTLVVDTTAAEFPSLGQDCVLSLLRQLPLACALRLRHVSKDFAAAAEARQMENEALELAHSDRLSDEILRRLLAQSPVLKTLSIGGCDHFKSECLQSAISKVQTLHTLELSSTSIDAACFALLWCSLPNLTSLDVDNCHDIDSSELDRYLARPTLERCAARIQRLSIASCRLLSVRTVSLLCRSCADRLTDLDASGYDELCSEDVRAISSACPSLRRVRLVESERLDDACCTHLASNCARLVAIELSWCEEVGTTGLVQLIRACPKLEECELRCCSNASARHVMRALSSHAPELRILNLNRCDDSYEDDGVEDEDDEAKPSATLLASRDEVASAAPHLFSALGLAVTMPCRLISPIAQCSTKLQWLDVGWMADLIDDAACALLLASLPQLRVLSLEGCKRLSDCALMPLLPRKSWLALSDRPQLKEEAEARAEAAAEEKEAHVAAAFPATADCGAALLRLNCSWVDGITTKALHAVINSHAERRRQVLARRIERRLEAALSRGDLHSHGPHEHSLLLPSRAEQLLCLDYFGACWGTVDGKPSHCPLEDLPGKALTGWVAAYHGAEDEPFGVS